MKNFVFFEKYVVPEGTLVHCDDCKYCLYPLKEEDVLLAEQKLSIKFPEDLREFYLEIGYGYVGQDEPDFMNEIMHPLEIVKLKNGEDFYENMDREDSEYYQSEDVLPFFNLGGEFDYLVIQLTGEDKGGIIYFGEKIADNFTDFINKMKEKTDYFIDFEE